MERPKEAIERMRTYANDGFCVGDIQASLKTILDWLEGKHVCEWPAYLTRDWLLRLANEEWNSSAPQEALRALAAIAPVRKKRVVDLWHRVGLPEHILEARNPGGNAGQSSGWEIVARNVEIED